jgi:hypothetical protein
MQTWISKTKIAWLDHLQVLRKGKDIVLDALNSFFVFSGAQHALDEAPCAKKIIIFDSFLIILSEYYYKHGFLRVK